MTGWMWTLFIKALDFHIAARILDNFLLDGEIFIFKVGIALLINFETAFLKQPRYLIEERLHNMRGHVEEHLLFAIVEDQVLIDEEEFKREILKQQWSKEKGRVFSIFAL